MNKLTCLAVLVTILLTTCKKADLNDTKDENGTFSPYFRATIKGVNWAASPSHIGASLDNNGVPIVVKIHADLGASNEYFYMTFLPMSAADTAISSTGMANRMEFHRNSQKWISATGNLNIHKAGTVNKHQYSGTFSGTFINSAAKDTMLITNGEYLAQGIF